MPTNGGLFQCVFRVQHLGADATDVITAIWSSGSSHWALRSTVGAAAAVVVKGDRFQKAE